MVMPRHRSPMERILGLPPIDEIRELVTGPLGRQLNNLLAKLEKLNQDKEGLAEIFRLLEFLRQLDQEGTLDKINGVLDKLPQGAAGRQTLIELRKLLDSLLSKLEKFSGLLNILEEKDK